MLSVFNDFSGLCINVKFLISKKKKKIDVLRQGTVRMSC